MSRLTWLVLILVAVWGIAGKTSVQSTIPDVELNMTKEELAQSKIKLAKEAEEAELARIKKEKNLPKNLVNLDFEPSKGGFGNVMISDFTITNKNKSAIKDISIKCTNYANSSAMLGTNSKTIYEVIPSHETKTFKKFNMGFIHSQTSNSSCRIVSFSFDGERVFMGL